MQNRVVMIATAMAFLLGLPDADAVTLVVAINHDDCPTALFQTISDAVAVAQDGDTILVCPGTYPEQVVLTKSVRLVGQGHPVVQPGTLGTVLPSPLGGKRVAAGIVADDTHVFLTGLDLDLSATTGQDCRTILAGVYLRNANALMSDVDIGNVRVPAAPNCDTGVGLFAESGAISLPDGATLLGQSKVTIRSSRFHDVQKGGVVVNGVGTTFHIHKSEIVGDGPTAAIVQNGIQVGFGARAQIGALAIHGFVTQAAGKAAGGVLAYQADRADVLGTTVTDSQTGVLIVGKGFVRGAALGNLSGDGVALIGDGSLVMSTNIVGAAVSGVYERGDRNAVVFGFIDQTPTGIWNDGGSGNVVRDTRFGPSVSTSQSSGDRDFDATTAAPLSPLCQSDADCDDGDPCTVDTCDLSTNVCQHVAGCDDGNPCTVDSCDPTLGCQNVAVPDGTPCGTAMACVGGVCS